MYRCCTTQHDIMRTTEIFEFQPYKIPHIMMTSSNENIFRVTGHSCGEFTGPRWIPAELPAHASHVSALELFAPDFMPVSTRQGVVTWIVYGYTCVGSDEEYIQARILHKLYVILLKLPIYHLNHSVKSNERLVIDSGPDYSMCDQREITTAGLSTML